VWCKFDAVRVCKIIIERARQVQKGDHVIDNSWDRRFTIVGELYVFFTGKNGQRLIEQFYDQGNDRIDPCLVNSNPVGLLPPEIALGEAVYTLRVDFGDDIFFDATLVCSPHGQVLDPLLLAFCPITWSLYLLTYRCMAYRWMDVAWCSTPHWSMGLPRSNKGV